MSSDDSDSESVARLLSPSDGTFGQSYVPEEIMMQNPTHPENAQASKEQEARELEEERRVARRQAAAEEASRPGPAGRSYGSFRGESYQAYCSQFENLHARPVADDQASVMTHPPPAYSDIATSINGGSRPPTIYNTMTETDRFFPTGPPQDLGGDTEEQPLLGGRPRRRSIPWRSCRFIAKVIVVLGCLALALAFIVTVARHLSGNKTPMLVPIVNEPSGTAPSLCPRATLSASAEVTLSDLKNVAFVEQKIVSTDHHDSSYSQLSIKGKINVKRLQKSDTTAYVHFDFHSTDQEILDRLQLYTAEDDRLKLFVVEWRRLALGGHGPCVVVEATIFINPEADLDSFMINSEHLDIVLDRDMNLNTQSAELRTVLGDIISHSTDEKASLESRELRIETRTGNVEGEYPLLDLLSITTTTGTVEAVVAARPAGEKAKPAVLEVRTWTGHIGLDTPALHRSVLPARDYRVTVESHTGSINAVGLPHGSSTSITASTSSINAKLYPAGQLSHTSSIIAKTNTGSVDVQVVPHVKYPHDAMPNLNGEYGSTTGSIRVTHPLQWEGSVHAETMTSSIDVQWPGLARQSGNNKGWFKLRSTFDGSKGDGKGSVAVSSRTGSIHLVGADA